MIETNVINLALSNGFQAEDTGGNCSALVKHFNGFDVVITSHCGDTMPETIIDGIEIGVYDVRNGKGWEYPAMFCEGKSNLFDFFKGNNRKREHVVETLRKIFQDIQDENEKVIEEDGTGNYTSDGEWLDMMIEAVKELLEYEQRP